LLSVELCTYVHASHASQVVIERMLLDLKIFHFFGGGGLPSANNRQVFIQILLTNYYLTRLDENIFFK
jgi:hypothetical protein